MELLTSRLYSFMDQKRGLAAHFLQGQKLLSDLVVTHHLGPSGVSFYRRLVLSAQFLSTYLKHGESIGVYVDCEDPYFRFKMETNHAGMTRTLLLPEGLDEFPATVTGMLRVTKIFPRMAPYNTVVELRETPVDSIITKLLHQSYQVKSWVFVSETSDQAFMIAQLPKLQADTSFDERTTLENYRLQFEKKLQDFCNEAMQEDTLIIETAQKTLGLDYLSGRDVTLHCPCSKERMVLGLKGLTSFDQDEIFEDSGTTEVRCDYCRTTYVISKSDL